jgi:hypothetical protein
LLSTQETSVYNCFIANPDTTTFLIALWGAVTGTVAVGILVGQQLLDRSRIEVKASMSHRVGHLEPVARLSVEVEVTNRGRRSVTIEQVGVVLPDDGKRDRNVARKETAIFDATAAGKSLRLGEGEKQTFRHDFPPEQWDRAMAGKTARVFVRLTSGKEYSAKSPIPPQNFPPVISNQ